MQYVPQFWRLFAGYQLVERHTRADDVLQKFRESLETGGAVGHLSHLDLSPAFDVLPAGGNDDQKRARRLHRFD